MRPIKFVFINPNIIEIELLRLQKQFGEKPENENLHSNKLTAFE